jgi:hypothetical protein
LTDATPNPTPAEWAAAMLATLPRLTDEQWNRVNATLGITTAQQGVPADRRTPDPSPVPPTRVDQPTHPPAPRSARPSGVAA